MPAPFEVLRSTLVSLLVSLGSLAACSPRLLAERVFLGGHFALTRNVPYAPGARQRLDVYAPRGGRSGAPVVVFLYGGRWQHGSKEQYRLVGDALTRRGVLAVVPDYRVYPAVRFPAWVQDAAAAVRWTRDNISRFGGDPDRIFLAGHSAGGHTVALLALDDHYLREAGVRSSAIRGAAVLAGPVATEWTDADVQALMGPRASWPATYPLTYADGSGPPLLLLHGARDRVVSPANSVRLAERVRERGGCARAVMYRGLDHVGIVVALALPRLEIAPVFEDLMRFLARPDQPACRAAQPGVRRAVVPRPTRPADPARPSHLARPSPRSFGSGVGRSPWRPGSSVAVQRDSSFRPADSSSSSRLSTGSSRRHRIAAKRIPAMAAMPTSDAGSRGRPRRSSTR